MNDRPQEEIKALPLLDYTVEQWDELANLAHLWYVSTSPPLANIEIYMTAVDDLDNVFLVAQWAKGYIEATVGQALQARHDVKSGALYIEDSSEEFNLWLPLRTLPYLHRQ